MPVLCGSAFKNKGVQPLLDAVVDYLPSPTDVAAVTGLKPDSDEELVRRTSDDEPFAALAFKIMTDPFVGSLTFIRIYSGVVESASAVLNTVKDNRERVGRMLQMHANSREDIKEARAGDIVALAGLKNTTTGDTLCDPLHPVVLEGMAEPLADAGGVFLAAQGPLAQEKRNGRRKRRCGQPVGRKPQRRGHSARLPFVKAAMIKACVKSALRHQFGMRTRFHDAAMIHDIDAVGIQNG